MLTPKPRGALSQTLAEALRSQPAQLERLASLAPEHVEDEQIALWTLYELHYGGFEDVDDRLEWHPAVLELRWRLEERFEARLHDRLPDSWQVTTWDPEHFFEAVAGHDGASLAGFVQRTADKEQVLELLRHRSIYHLKESDPTAWAVPRLPTGPKAALAELQYDEYGAGRPGQLHSRLFALGLEACGLDPAYGAYIDDAPVEVLEQNNAMSLFGLHRRLRAAALGHLAAFEATSSLPSRRLAQGLRRLDLADEMARYYDEHVEADAVHEQLAVRSICGGLVEAEPVLVPDVYLGAFTCLDLEDRLAGRLLAEWAT